MTTAEIREKIAAAEREYARLLEEDRVVNDRRVTIARRMGELLSWNGCGEIPDLRRAHGQHESKFHAPVSRAHETCSSYRRQMLKAPFPWFGGKSRAAHLVWDRFGAVPNYVEPFAGSLAVLLNRPHAPGTETVNDLDCYLANFWRALQHEPDEVAAWADWPVNEADQHARHLWLCQQEEFRERMKTDPDYYDLRIAGWWVWGQCIWIGSGWATRGPGCIASSPTWATRGSVSPTICARLPTGSAPCAFAVVRGNAS